MEVTRPEDMQYGCGGAKKAKPEEKAMGCGPCARQSYGSGSPKRQQRGIDVSHYRCSAPESPKFMRVKHRMRRCRTCRPCLSPCSPPCMTKKKKCALRRATQRKKKSCLPCRRVGKFVPCVSRKKMW